MEGSHVKVEIEADAPVKLLGYYPPFAPRWIRLQELLLPVKVDM